VAVRDELHITIPRDLKQFIPGQPDFILTLPQSSAAHTIGGYIDETRPHCVNNMMVGDLGCFEVLLMACELVTISYRRYPFLETPKYSRQLWIPRTYLSTVLGWEYIIASESANY